MKVLLIGKSGMLGSCFLRMLSSDEDFEMYAFGREELDIRDGAQLHKLFGEISPDFVINCAAYTDVDGAEDNRDEAFAVNAEAVENLAEACVRESAVLVHFSTDYVFDGAKAGFYENDQTAPLNVYGASKLAGEIATAKCPEHYIIRSSWLFGDGGKNFVDTMCKLGKDRSELSVVDDQAGSPTFTNDLCRVVIEWFLRPFLRGVHRAHKHTMDDDHEWHEKLDFGVYHITNSGDVCWSDFAREIFRVKALDVEVKNISSDEFAAKAKRPANSVLRSRVDFGLRDWKEALMAYLA